MRYRVYSGERGTHAAYPPDKTRIPYTEFDAADDALFWAQKLRENGRVAPLIAGDDGTLLTKREIDATLKSQRSTWQKATRAA